MSPLSVLHTECLREEPTPFSKRPDCRPPRTYTHALRHTPPKKGDMRVACPLREAPVDKPSKICVLDKNSHQIMLPSHNANAGGDPRVSTGTAAWMAVVFSYYCAFSSVRQQSDLGRSCARTENLRIISPRPWWPWSLKQQYEETNAECIDTRNIYLRLISLTKYIFAWTHCILYSNSAKFHLMPNFSLVYMFYIQLLY